MDYPFREKPSKGGQQVQLQFINYKDPEKDSKKKEYKKIVSKYAMLQRPRDEPAESKPTARKSSGSSKKSRSPATSPSEAGSSPPSLVDSSPSIDALSEFSYDDNIHHKPFGTLDEYWNNSGLSSVSPLLLVPTLPNAEQAKLRQQERSAQRREAKRATRTAAPRNTTSELVRYGQSPPIVNGLVGSAGDPFQTLPINSSDNAHCQALLKLYMNVELIAPVFANGDPDVVTRMRMIRRFTWFPLARKSEATMSALIAYLETTPTLAIRSRNPAFLYEHTSNALVAVKHAIEDPENNIDDTVCLAIILLMITSQRMSDTQGFRAHAAGLAALLSRRAAAFERNKSLEETTFRRGSEVLNPDGRANPNRCLACRKNPSMRASSVSSDHSSSSSSSNKSSPELASAQIRAYKPQTTRFHELIASGVLSEPMHPIIEQAMIWSQVSEQAKRDRISAAGAASHAWADGLPSEGAMTALDEACFHAIRLCLYLSAWLDWQHSCAAVRSFLKAIYEFLCQTPIDALIEHVPDLMMWIALTAGPFMENEQRAWYSCILLRARSVRGVYDIETVLLELEQRFFWNPTLTPFAIELWEETELDAGSLIPQVPCGWENLSIFPTNQQEVYQSTEFV